MRFNTFMITDQSESHKKWSLNAAQVWNDGDRKIKCIEQFARGQSSLNAQETSQYDWTDIYNKIRVQTVNGAVTSWPHRIHSPSEMGSSPLRVKPYVFRDDFTHTIFKSVKKVRNWFNVDLIRDQDVSLFPSPKPTEEFCWVEAEATRPNVLIIIVTTEVELQPFHFVLCQYCCILIGSCHMVVCEVTDWLWLIYSVQSVVIIVGKTNCMKFWKSDKSLMDA